MPGKTTLEQVDIMSPGSSDRSSAMTHDDMMNIMGNGVMMENEGAQKCGALEDQSCERGIEHHHRRMIKNHEWAHNCMPGSWYVVYYLAAKILWLYAMAFLQWW